MGKRTIWAACFVLDANLDASMKDGRDGWMLASNAKKKKKVQPVIEVQAEPVLEVQAEAVLEDQAEAALATPLARAEMSSSKPATPHGELPAVWSLASELSLSSLSPLNPVLSPSMSSLSPLKPVLSPSTLFVD